LALEIQLHSSLLSTLTVAPSTRRFNIQDGPEKLEYQRTWQISVIVNICSHLEHC